jgi:hypothetical protein
VKCLDEAIRVPELVKSFDRLYGFNLSRRGAPLDLAIDKATGFEEAGMIEFMNFVWEFVFLRVPLDEKRAAEFAALLKEMDEGGDQADM